MVKKETVYTLQRIDPATVFKVLTALLALVIGLVGLVYCLITFAAFKYTRFGGAVLGTLFGVLILSPIYGLALALLAAAYNFVAGKVGGLKITVSLEEPETTA